VGVQEQRAPAAAAARDRDDVRPPRRRLRELDFESCVAAPVGDEARDIGLAGAARAEVRVRRLDRDERPGELGGFAGYDSTPSSSSEIRNSSASR
jgi:hypothetical protein